MADRVASVAFATEGLKETLAGLDHLAKLDAQRSLRKEFKSLSERAEALARTGADTPAEKRAAQSLKAGSSSTAAFLRYGAGVPGAMGTEFGAGRDVHRLPRKGSPARTGRRSSHTAQGWMLGWNQFRPWRGSDEMAGYFVWPGIRQAVEEMLPVMQDGIDRVFAGEGVR